VNARQPVVGGGVQLSWQRPVSGRVTEYRVYRGTTPGTQTLLATVHGGLGYHDASAARALYLYRVTAVGAGGEGPSSALAGMVGKGATPAGMVREDVDRRMVVSNTHVGLHWSRRWA